ncbi:MAG: DUF2207 domain-containing protein [Clostridia bacterium]|nr:DUF2207 domain-containing protein [Clostridia bacterium]
MKKNNLKSILFILFIAIAIVLVLVLYNNGVIRNYKIKNFEINATVNSNGDMYVEELTDYEFKGAYNGITITLPKNINNSSYFNNVKSINDSELPDRLYNNTDLTDVQIYEKLSDGELVRYIKTTRAINGNSNVYTVENLDGYETYKIYSPTSSENKTFFIKYTLKNVAVKHLDSAELYWNFIGGRVESKIDNLKINVNIPQNNSKIISYTHGQVGKGKILSSSNDLVSVSYKNIKPYQFVALRLVFDNTSISNSTKISYKEAVPIIKDSEKKLENVINKKENFNMVIIFAYIVLAIYWIILLIKYEFEKDIKIYPENIYDIIDEDNPIILACIAQSRDMHPRDIIATLVNLASKNAIYIISRNGYVNDKEVTKYSIKKNYTFFEDSKNYEKLDEIEKLVFEIFTKKTDGNNEVELETRLKNIGERKEFIDIIKKLDETVTDKLYNIGANSKRIPKPILIINNIIFIIICLIILLQAVSYITIDSLTLNQVSDKTMSTRAISYNIITIFTFILTMFPLILVILKLIVNLINVLGRRVDEILFKISIKKVFKTTITIILIASILTVVLTLLTNSKYIINDVILFTIALTIILTDNLMSNHSTKILKKYYTIKVLEDKVEKGSLLNEKEIKDEVLWGKYLAFSIALGNTDISEYSSKLSNYTDIINIPDFVRLCEENTGNYYSLYNVDRKYLTIHRINEFNSFMNSVLKSSSSGSGGHSSFGGGGFSGGGGFGGGRGAF